MNQEIAWSLELQLQAGKSSDFQALAREMVAATKTNEPGTLFYEWTLSADGTRCHIYERYVDSQAALTHTAAFGVSYAARFLALVTPVRMVVYGSPSAALKDALAMLDPVYMQPIAGFRR